MRQRNKLELFGLFSFMGMGLSLMMLGWICFWISALRFNLTMIFYLIVYMLLAFLFLNIYDYSIERVYQYKVDKGEKSEW